MGEPLFESIRPRTKRLGRRLIHMERVDSTMDEARRLADVGAQDGTVVVADEQTAGRGREARSWHSPKGSLYATILVRPSKPLASLALIPTAAGVSVARAVRKLVRAPARLKWPNDVWIEGRKVAGILVESRFVGERPSHILVGIGVNGDLREEDFPPDLRGTATSLSLWAGRHVCMPALLKLILEDLEPRVTRILEGATIDTIADAEAASAIMGARVRVETARGSREGTAVGLGPLGELVVETEAGRETIAAGDCLLLRPADPARR